ncbi:hypothetical protein DXC92_28410 [Clostridiales bacterium TF09-2AC]|nr:hypothetical protein DXC92_28410 [Clostridiales bacterium TF09-2AC]
MCLKIHSRHLHAPLRGRFGPNSVNVARYASLTGTKSPTKWDAQLTESNFQTRPRSCPSGTQRPPLPPQGPRPVPQQEALPGPLRRRSPPPLPHPPNPTPLYSS